MDHPKLGRASTVQGVHRNEVPSATSQVSNLVRSLTPASPAFRMTSLSIAIAVFAVIESFHGG
jgi:hypothetical protein